MGGEGHWKERGDDSGLFVSKKIMDFCPLSNNRIHYTCIFIIG